MELPAPMLPTAGALPVGSGWAFEMKWDGVRLISGLERGVLQMRTRQGKAVSASQFPELTEIAEVGDVILDGELTVFDGDRTDFGAVLRRLLARGHRAAVLAEEYPATVLVFDVLRFDGEDLRRRPYEERRAILESLELPEGWVVPPAFANGPATVEVSLEHGLEGVVAKRLASRYSSGRSRNWVKQRHQGIIDATVVGWVRRPSGGLSLLLAEPGTLRYVGRCTAPRGLVDALAPLAVSSPAAAVPAQAGVVQWVQPVLQVEVTASSREPDGRLRQARFVRARLDQLG
ncbi:DNA ligase [Glycomyces sp. NPDC021274]|uniref:ATP-dependent DNA ligase n=1 Tax=Glycomyces sp. NPDC021274 TaxID=3155120 RepID=UPI0033E9A202